MILKYIKISYLNFIIIYLFLLFILFFTSYTFFIKDFKELEYDRNNDNINTLLSGMNTNIESIKNSINDYSKWDDTYDFILDSNKDYINENFREGSNTLEELNVDFIIYVNNQQKVVYSKYNDKTFSKIKTDFEEKIIEYFKDIDNISTITNFNKVLYFTKSEILRTDRKGVVRGYILGGKIIDNKTLHSITNIFEKIKLTKIKNNIDVILMKTPYIQNIKVATILDKNEITNNILIYDNFNTYVSSISTTNKMKILTKGHTTIYSFNIIIALFLLIVLLYLFNRQEKEKLQDQIKFKLLFQDSHFLAVVISKAGEIIEINNTALDFLGSSNEIIRKEKFWNLKCWKDKDKIKIKKLITGKINKKFNDELSVIDKNSEERILDFTLSSIINGNNITLVAIILDITERKQKEEKLKQAYTVFNHTKDGIIITDKNTRLIDTNKAFEDITGYSKDEVINKKTSILKSNVHSKQFYEKMWNSILKDGYWEGEITNLNKNGEEYIELLTINSIFDKNGEVINYIGIFNDITEQKVKSYILYQQSKLAAMGEMLGNIAHQWRQPLSVISTASTGIKMQNELGALSNEDLNYSMDSINESAQYLSQTIEDFRGFFDPRNNEEKEFQLSQTINKTLNLVKSQFTTKSIEIIKDIEIFSLISLENELIQVLVNILNNAKDALVKLENRKRLIFINLYSKENEIIIEIKDNGGGVEEDIMDKIFEPYFTTKHQSQGTGIGLYMSEKIVREHLNGILIVSNENYIYEDINYTGAMFTIKIALDKE